MPSRFLYHVTPARNLASIGRQGLRPRKGNWHSSLAAEASSWSPRIFLTTSFMAALDVARDFDREGHHSVIDDYEPYYVILTIVRSAVSENLYPDVHVRVRPRDSGLRARCKRIGSVCTVKPVPPAAIRDAYYVNGAEFERADFLRFVCEPKRLRKARK